ncbi:hypothetical protein C7C46_11685 [Streptomyces tateyamensis]|uniref:Uncharacterized protein n=1 Tax=Streptomyces tateyamensis TaxID=565073 RepID=A0A2V4NCU8_9ACTN|nr:hypothetical protein [Streptomyces tateyamensis]PYC81367.1 hypothetical protein C7C46_11685 [Streptomyces tateyamensis]
MTEQHLDAQPALEAQLADLAGAVPVGPPPLAQLLTGGRRRLRRRRTAAVTATVAACLLLGGTALLGPDHRSAAPVPPAGPPSPSAHGGRTFGPLDPFTPDRAVVGEGTTPSGQHWQAWVARWPAATEQQSLQQAQQIWQEQHAAGNLRLEPTKKSLEGSWVAYLDVCDLYVTVDGVRQPLDAETLVPGRASELNAFASRDQPGLALGRRPLYPPNDHLDNHLGDQWLTFVEVRPEVTRAVVHQADGSTLELRPAALGDSSVHWIAFARSDAAKGGTLELYAADGTLLGSSGHWFE